jgi:hypothetical protein
MPPCLTYRGHQADCELREFAASADFQPMPFFSEFEELKVATPKIVICMLLCPYLLICMILTCGSDLL